MSLRRKPGATPTNNSVLMQNQTHCCESKGIQPNVQQPKAIVVQAAVACYSTGCFASNGTMRKVQLKWQQSQKHKQLLHGQVSTARNTWPIHAGTALQENLETQLQPHARRTHRDWLPLRQMMKHPSVARRQKEKPNPTVGPQ